MFFKNVADARPAVVSAVPIAPQPDTRLSAPTATAQALADEARAWSAEASFPMGPLFAWLEASAAPDVRLVSVEARARPRLVLLEIRADRAASIAPYLSTLARSSGPAARWALKSIRADVGQGGVTAAIEGAL